MTQCSSFSFAQMQQARQARDKRFDGLFFVCVSSTGIFCRPICPAKLANEENVTYQPTAAHAMQAGYRPCKLCKPDSAPHAMVDLEGSSFVSDAVRILERKPETTLKALATQLGISTRHLRERFQRHLGLSPSHYQRSVQLLFAKQLLQQTQLSVLDIAVACGFQSSRALQLAFKEQFNLTPSSFRKTEPSEPTMDTQLFLPYRPPYLWEPLRDFLAQRSIEGIEDIDESGYTRTFVIEGRPGKVTALHQPEKCGFNVELSVQQPSDIKPVIVQLSRVLDLEANWLTIGKAIEKTGFPLSEKTQGTRIPGVWDIYEAGCRAIFGQQVSVAAAINKTKQFVNIVRESTECVGFPQPDQVTPAMIDTIGMPKTRKNTLQLFTEYMADETNRNEVERGNTEGLLALKGIGPWTCQYIMMRGVGHTDVWMPKDLAILRQCEKFSLKPELAKPWSSYLTLVLWRDYMESNE